MTLPIGLKIRRKNLNLFPARCFSRAAIVVKRSICRRWSEIER